MPRRAAGAPLADDDADDRRVELAHLHQVLGDDRRLPALLGLDAGVSAGGVDEADDRQPELGREPHLQQGLAIALRVGAAEVAGGPLGEVLALLVADEHHLLLAEVAQAGDDRLVVADGPVAVEFEELVEDQVEVVAGLGALGMPRDLDGLPGVEVRVDLRFSAASSRRRRRICSPIFEESPPARFLAYCTSSSARRASIS